MQNDSEEVDRNHALAFVDHIFGPFYCRPDSLRLATREFLYEILKEISWCEEKVERVSVKKKKGEGESADKYLYRGEYDLARTYALFRIVFILVSPWWDDFIFWLQGGHLRSSDPQIGWKSETFPPMPLLTLREAYELLLWRDYCPENPVHRLNADEILDFSKKSRLFTEEEIRVEGHRRFRIDSHLFVEINPMTPIAVLDEEIDKLKTMVREHQAKIKSEDECESISCGGPPDYYTWDHRRISTGSAAVKSLLGSGREMIKVFQHKKKNPQLTNWTDRARSYYKANDGNVDSLRHTYKGLFDKAESHIESALFGNFPPR